LTEPATRRRVLINLGVAVVLLVTASKAEITLPGGALENIAADAWPQFLEVHLNEAACGPRPAVTFRYTVTPAEKDLSKTYTIERPSPVPGLTKMFLPVFQLYKGLEFSDQREGCLVAAYRVTELTRLPLLLGAVLPPDWATLPLHQRLLDWEPERPAYK